MEVFTPVGVLIRIFCYIFRDVGKVCKGKCNILMYVSLPASLETPQKHKGIGNALIYTPV